MPGEWIDTLDEHTVKTRSRIGNVIQVEKNDLRNFRDSGHLSPGLLHLIAVKLLELNPKHPKVIWVDPLHTRDSLKGKSMAQALDKSFIGRGIDNALDASDFTLAEDLILFPVTETGGKTWGLNVFLKKKKHLYVSFLKAGEDQTSQKALAFCSDLAAIKYCKAVKAQQMANKFCWERADLAPEHSGMFVLAVIRHLASDTALGPADYEKLIQGAPLHEEPEKPGSKPKEPKVPKEISKEADLTNVPEQYQAAKKTAHKKNYETYLRDKTTWERDREALLERYEQEKAAWEKRDTEYAEWLKTQHQRTGGVDAEACQNTYVWALEELEELFTPLVVTPDDAPKTRIEPTERAVGPGTMVACLQMTTSDSEELVSVQQAAELLISVKSRLSNHRIRQQQITRDSVRDEDVLQGATDGWHPTEERSSWNDVEDTKANYLVVADKKTSIGQKLNPDGQARFHPQSPPVLSEGEYGLSLARWPTGYLEHLYPLSEPLDWRGISAKVDFDLAVAYGHYNKKCPCCQNDEAKFHHFEIRESTISKLDCQEFSEALEVEEERETGRGGDTDKFMIGILTFEADDGAWLTYVAASGPPGSAREKRVEAAAKALGKSFRYATGRRYVKYDENEVSEAGVTPRNWVGDPLELAKSPYTQNEPGNCAAPKLIQQFYADYPDDRNIVWLAMTEQWFVPSGEENEYSPYGKGQTVPSCETCQLQVPAMLCDATVSPTVELYNDLYGQG